MGNGFTPTLIESIALMLTSFGILLKIMAEAQTPYPPTAIRGVSLAMAMLLVAGIVALLGEVFSIPPLVLDVATLLVVLGLVIVMFALYPMVIVEEHHQDFKGFGESDGGEEPNSND